MPVSLAYLGTLAFAAFVLWLRARRAETVDGRLGRFAEVLEAYQVSLDGYATQVEANRRNAFDSVAREGLEGVTGTLAEQKKRLDELGDRVETLMLKSGFEPRKRAA